MTTLATQTPNGPPGKPPRKRHWVRWIFISIAGLAAILVTTVVLYVKLAPVPAPLALSATPAATPTGPIDGTWTAGAGTQAGFRIQQTVFFASSDVVERTTSVDGTMTVSGNQITTATFTVDLTTITNNGKTTPQLVTSLDTEHHPNATVTLTQPITLDPAFATVAPSPPRRPPSWCCAGCPTR